MMEFVAQAQGPWTVEEAKLLELTFRKNQAFLWMELVREVVVVNRNWHIVVKSCWDHKLVTSNLVLDDYPRVCLMYGYHLVKMKRLQLDHLLDVAIGHKLSSLHWNQPKCLQQTLPDTVGTQRRRH